MNDEEQTSAMRWFTAWWFWVVALLLATTLIYAWVSPHLERKYAEVTRQSVAYVASIQSALRTMKADHEALSVRVAALRKTDSSQARDEIDAVVAQQRGIVRFMRQEAARIPRDVPPDVEEFLRRQP